MRLLNSPDSWRELSARLTIGRWTAGRARIGDAASGATAPNPWMLPVGCGGTWSIYLPTTKRLIWSTAANTHLGRPRAGAGAGGKRARGRMAQALHDFQ